MSGNGVSWTAFPAVRVSDGKTFGHVIVMNRTTSRSIRVVPHDISANAKYWLKTGDCIRKDDKCYYPSGLECLIPEVLEKWGLKLPKKEDVRPSSHSFPVWKLCHPSCVKDEVEQGPKGYSRVLTIEWPKWSEFFEGAEKLSFETHILKGNPMKCASLASNGWFKGAHAHIAKVCDIQRPEPKEVSDSRAQVMADLGL